MDETGEADPALAPGRRPGARPVAPRRGRGRVAPASLALMAGVALAGLVGMLVLAPTPGMCWGVALLLLLCR